MESGSQTGHLAFKKNEIVVWSRGHFEENGSHKACLSWESVQTLEIEGRLMEYVCKMQNNGYVTSTKTLRTEALAEA